MAMLENLFTTLFAVSVSTSLALIPLLLLAPLARRRYPARWCGLLWLLVAARLLVPFNVSFPQPPVQIAIPSQVTGPITGAPVLPPAGQQPAAPGAGALPGAAAASPLSWLQLAALVWLAGAGLYLVAQALLYWRFAAKTHRFAQAAPPQTHAALQALAAEMKLKHVPRLRINPLGQSPVLTGLVRPVIYLPGKEYPPGELHMVLRHELVHYARRDVWRKLVFLLACALHWFNPVVWLLARQAARDIEIACDDVVVQGLNKTQRALYGQAILNGVPRAGRLAPALSTHLGGSKRTMKRRLQNLFDFTAKRRGAAALCAAVLCVGVMASLVACVPQPQSESTPPDAPPANPASSTSQQGSSPSQAVPVATPPMKTEEYDGKTWYIVENESQLRSIAYDDETLARNYIQNGNIALTGEWTPIGNGEHPFTGTYTGNGYHISGLQMAGPQVQNAGLFGYVENGVVYNVTLLQPQITPAGSGTEIRVVALASGAVARSNLVLTGAKPAAVTAPAITWDSVTIRYYEDGTPYVKDNFTNHTSKAILGYSYAMLAYDREGNPLQANWWEFDSSGANTHLNTCEIDADRGPGSSYYVAPGATLDVRGGWTVGAEVDSDGSCTIAYVLVCFSEITFEDGTVWQNPGYSEWLETYHEKPVDVKQLESYYPFTQTVGS